VDHIKDQRTWLINTTFILGTVSYVWYSQHGCRYCRHLYIHQHVATQSVNFKKILHTKNIILVGAPTGEGPGPWPPGPRLNLALVSLTLPLIPLLLNLSYTAQLLRTKCSSHAPGVLPRWDPRGDSRPPIKTPLRDVGDDCNFHMGAKDACEMCTRLHDFVMGHKKQLKNTSN